MKKIDRQDSDSLFAKWCLSADEQITEEEVEYFREHPDQIDEVTAPGTIHKLFLALGGVLGIVLVGVSKVLNFSAILAFLPDGVQEFVIDIFFELGVALLGGVIVAYLLVVLLAQQQESARRWKVELRKRIAELEKTERVDPEGLEK